MRHFLLVAMAGAWLASTGQRAAAVTAEFITESIAQR